MKWVIVFICTCVVTIGHCQSAKDAQLLEKAYLLRSDRDLGIFMRSYERHVPHTPATELMRLGDTMRLAYHVATEWYRQKLKCTDSSRCVFICQPSVYIYLNDKVLFSEAEREKYIIGYINTHVEGDSSRRYLLRREKGKLNNLTLGTFGPEAEDQLIGTLDGLRPQVACGDKPVLYFSSMQQMQLLFGFADMKHIKAAKQKTKAEMSRRLAFLRDKLGVRSRFDAIDQGDFWSAVSISSITIDRQWRYARVACEIQGKNYNVYMKEQKGKWLVISTQWAKAHTADLHGR